jgi:hypothetical protein
MEGREYFADVRNKILAFAPFYGKMRETIE